MRTVHPSQQSQANDPPARGNRVSGVTELTIEKQGDTILLRPVRPSWTSLSDEPRADANFLRERPDLIEVGRFSFDEGNSDR